MGRFGVYSTGDPKSAKSCRLRNENYNSLQIGNNYIMQKQWVGGGGGDSGENWKLTFPSTQITLLPVVVPCSNSIRWIPSLSATSQTPTRSPDMLTTYWPPAFMNWHTDTINVQLITKLRKRKSHFNKRYVVTHNKNSVGAFSPFLHGGQYNMGIPPQYVLRMSVLQQIYFDCIFSWLPRIG